MKNHRFSQLYSNLKLSTVIFNYFLTNNKPLVFDISDITTVGGIRLQTCC